MPNWCMNEVRVKGAKLEEIKDALSKMCEIFDPSIDAENGVLCFDTEWDACEDEIAELSKTFACEIELRYQIEYEVAWRMVFKDGEAIDGGEIDFFIE